MMICKISITVQGSRPETESTARCELTVDGQDAAKLSAAQIRHLQSVCLTAVSEQSGFMSRSQISRLRPETGTAALRQLLRLYKAASRIPAFDLKQLQNLSSRLYQKPLEDLSIFEVAAITGTLKAVVRGMVDVQDVLKKPTSAMNGHADK